MFKASPYKVEFKMMDDDSYKSMMNEWKDRKHYQKSTGMIYEPASTI